MEDQSSLPLKKKRSADLTSSGSSKKQFLGENVEGEGEMKWDANTLRFQNRAMFCRIQEQKLEINSLNEKLNALKEKDTVHNEHLSVINRAWDHLNENLNLLLGRLDSGSKVSSLVPIKSDTTKTNQTSSLLNLLLGLNPLKSSIKREESADDDEEDDERFSTVDVERSLQQRTEQTSSILTRIIKAIEQEQISNEKLSNILQQNGTDNAPSGSSTKELGDEISRLREDATRNRNLVDDLQARYQSVHDGYEQMKTSNVKLRSQIKKLKNELLDAKDEVEISRKKLIKQETRYKDEIEKIKSEGVSTTSSTTSSTSEMSVNSSTGPSPGETGIKTESPRPNSGENKQLEEEVDELRTIVKMRSETLEKYESERLEMIKEIQKLRGELSNLSDDRVVRSRPYLALQEQILSMQTSMHEIQEHNKKLTNNLASQTQAFQTDREKWRDNEDRLKEKYEKSLREAELTLVRVRSERDTLGQKLDIKAGGAPSMQLVQELRSQITSRDSENKKLKEQVEKLKEDSNKLKTFKEDSKKSQEKILESLEQKTAELKVVHNQLHEYEVQLEDLKKRKKLWEEKESELKLVIEVFQKDNKDKRELAEVRVSEHKLLEEKNRLQSIVDKYEKNADNGSSNSTENETIMDLRVKLTRAEKSIKDLKDQIESQKEEIDGYIAEIEVIGKAYEDLQEQNTRLTSQLIEKEDSLTRMMSEQIRSSKMQVSFQEERDALQEKITKGEEKLKAQEEVIQKFEAKGKLITEQMKKMSEELRMNGMLADGLKRSARDSSMAAQEWKAQVDKCEKIVQEERQRAEEKALVAEKFGAKTGRLEEEVSTLKKRVERMGATGKGGENITDLLVQQLKHKITCTVCNDNEKDSVIARCFHTFCRPCIQKNLTGRSRKCPGCGKAFAESDVHYIY